MAKTEEQVSWNLSQAISGQIDALIQSCRRASLSGRILDCFHNAKEIRLLINHHFKPEERKSVDDLEEEINVVSLKIKKIGLVEEEDEFEYDYGNRETDVKRNLVILNNNRVQLVEKYRKTVLNLLDEYGYLMERKQDSSFME